MRVRDCELARQRKKLKRLDRESERSAANNLSGTGQSRALLICGIIALAHVIGLALLFTPFSGLFDSHPLIDQDWGLHFFHLNSLTAFWREAHTLWGYNPFFMAGYPSNTIQDLSIKFFELAALGLSSIALSPVQWFKICAFLTTASLPWMIYFAARNCFTGSESANFIAALAALLGTVYWWNSLPREMFFYGMIGFPVACYLSVLGIFLCYRLAQQGEKFGALHLGWFLFSVVILPLHVQSVVILLPPLIALFAARPALLTPRLLGWLAGAAALAFVINLPWLAPAFAHRGDDASRAITEQLPLFVSADPLIFVKDYLSTASYWSFRQGAWEKGFRLAVLLCGVWGIRTLLRGEKRDLGIMLAVGVATLFAISYFGSFVPFIKPWQPLRFKVPLDLLLVVGATHALTEWLRTPKNSHTPMIPLVVGMGLATFLINVAQTEAAARLQLRSRFIPELDAIVEWIKNTTLAEARVLFEESGDESGFVYDRSYLSSFLPALTGRQMIGGPINLYNDRHHFAEFHSGRMFKKTAPMLSDEQLKNYLNLYNVGAIVAFDPPTIERLRSLPGLVSIEQRIGPIYLMRVHQPLSWFVEGDGKVKAGFNRLELSDLKGKEIILKYHWIDALSATPAVKIAAVRLGDDPIPFIKLIDPPTAVTLRVGD
jgi:hypothetical protein